MSQFRKKPVVIEAEKVAVLLGHSAHSWPALPIWFRNAYEAGDLLICPRHIEIKTLEGTMRADWDDWIIRGVKGELYPCKPDIFLATYDAV